MRFLHPYYLLALLIIPGMIYWYKSRRRKRAFLRYSDLSLIKKIRPSSSLKYRHLPFILKIIAIGLLIMALARPQSGKSNHEINTEGLNIMLTLDISGSMRAEDFKPNNRLFVAKQVVADFIKGRESDQIGLVVFAGRSYTQCPLTIDYSLLLNFLETIEIGMIEDGTAIGMALANSVNRLKDIEAREKLIILLTDGQNNRGEIDPVTAAKLAQSMGIRVYTIGVGKEGGAPIPTHDPFFGKVYARGPDGRLLLTQMDEGPLREIARITKGQYFRATDPDSLKKIYKQIDQMEKTKIEVKHYMEYTELFYYFLIPGFILLLLSTLLGNTRLRTLP